METHARIFFLASFPGNHDFSCMIFHRISPGPCHPCLAFNCFLFLFLLKCLISRQEAPKKKINDNSNKRAKSQNCIQEEKIGYRRWGTKIRTHNSVYSNSWTPNVLHRKGTTFFLPVPQIRPYWECVRRCQNIARIRLVALDGASVMLIAHTSVAAVVVPWALSTYGKTTNGWLLGKESVHGVGMNRNLLLTTLLLVVRRAQLSIKKKKQNEKRKKPPEKKRAEKTNGTYCLLCFGYKVRTIMNLMYIWAVPSASNASKATQPTNKTASNNSNNKTSRGGNQRQRRPHNNNNNNSVLGRFQHPANHSQQHHTFHCNTFHDPRLICHVRTAKGELPANKNALH